MIRLVDISKQYGDSDSQFALTGINIEVDYGETVAIVGNSGSGKTTLLNIIGGLTHQTSGQYIFDDKIIDFKREKDATAFRRENVAFITQDYALLNEKTVYENIAIQLRIRKYNRKHIKSILYTVLNQVNLIDKMLRYPYELSGGERQRVAIARALSISPRILLADEPTAALDKDNTLYITQKIIHMASEKTAVIIVTHDTEIAKICDRTYHLYYGQIL